MSEQKNSSLFVDGNRVCDSLSNLSIEFNSTMSLQPEHVREVIAGLERWLKNGTFDLPAKFSTRKIEGLAGQSAASFTAEPGGMLPNK